MMGSETYHRWEPIEGLPEQPLSFLKADYDATNLRVAGPYAFGASSEWLEIKFDYVEAFKFYEEFSDPWMEVGTKMPTVLGEKWTWPLLEVEDSRWLPRVFHRNGGLSADDAWRHLAIVSLDFGVHIMTRMPPVSVRLLSEEPPWR